ncbi:MAG: hypothetical protein ACFB12_18835 [Leptolyngbyaceae cyanobacterium]
MKDEDVVSKRIGVTVPDKIHTRLEQWAELEGRPLANLCNFLLEKAVREAIEKGDLPSVDTSK